MTKYAAALAVVLLIGCGGQDQGPETAMDEGAEVPAEAATGTEDLSDVAGSVAAEQVQSCLELVAADKFAEAVPICMVAVSQNRDNEEVLAALALATAGAEVEAEASDAMDEATGMAQDAGMA